MKGILRLEIEKHQTVQADTDLSESGSVTNDSIDPAEHVADLAFAKCSGGGFDVPMIGSSKSNFRDGRDTSGNVPNICGNPDSATDDVSDTPLSPYIFRFACIYQSYPCSLVLQIIDLSTFSHLIFTRS